MDPSRFFVKSTDWFFFGSDMCKSIIFHMKKIPSKMTQQHHITKLKWSVLWYVSSRNDSHISIFHKFFENNVWNRVEIFLSSFPLIQSIIRNGIRNKCHGRACIFGVSSFFKLEGEQKKVEWPKTWLFLYYI